MKKIIILLLLFSTITVKADQIDLAKNAKSAIVLEASTGEIIFEKNSHEKLNPASMTKMMTMLLVVEAVEDGIIKWDDIVTVSSNASSMGGSQILLETNEQMSVNDLFKGVAIASGNDAAVALSEKIAGTEEMFVNMMNERAKELGLNDTNFKNCHGLDSANHYSSAYDMSLIAKELVKHSRVLEYTSIYEDYLRKDTDRSFWLVNTNKLVRFYKGVDGLKTGYTKEAGHCLTATANINNMRIITVVMGEPDSGIRNSEVSSIFDYVYAQYMTKQLLKENSILGTYDIEKAKQEKVDIIPKEEVKLFFKKNSEIKNIQYDLKIEELKAPLKFGDTVGKLNVIGDGKIIKTVDVTIKEDIKKANIFELYFRHLKDIFQIKINI